MKLRPTVTRAHRCPRCRGRRVGAASARARLSLPTSPTGCPPAARSACSPVCGPLCIWAPGMRPLFPGRGMAVQVSSLHITAMTCVLCKNSTQVDSKMCHIVQCISGNCLLLEILRPKGRLGHVKTDTCVITEVVPSRRPSGSWTRPGCYLAPCRCLGSARVPLCSFS